MDMRACDVVPVSATIEGTALWELGVASVQAAYEHLAGEMVLQLPHMVGPGDPGFAILERTRTLPSGQVVKLQLTLEVME